LALEDATKASQFADFILDARADGSVSQGEVAGGASAVRAESGQRAMLARLIGDPVLWKVRVEVGRVPRAGLSPRPVTAYEGHIYRPSRQARNAVQQDVLDQQVPFLSWREVPLTKVEYGS
ncbi:MAG: hypothetical protein KDA28_15245, partial [Phycisphaerales bacterium]|nr:hypothetical protein [Phycisphaerales bacterium]